MKNATLFGLLCFAYVSGSPLSAAEISGNVSLVSDYSFRGVSQTTRDPAIQGGFDLELGNGVAIGTWSSNVNYGASTTQELDLYVSYSGSLSETVSYTLTATQFEYPSEGDDLDYQEYGISLAINDLSLGLVLSPEYVGAGGPSFQYLSAGYSVGFGDSGSLDLAVGLSTVDEDDFFKEGSDSYIDYSIGVSMGAGGADIGIGLVGTDLDSGPDSDNRLVFSISKSL